MLKVFKCIYTNINFEKKCFTKYSVMFLIKLYLLNFFKIKQQEQKNGEKRKIEEVFGENPKSEISLPKRSCLEDSIAKFVAFKIFIKSC